MVTRHVSPVEALRVALLVRRDCQKYSPLCSSNKNPVSNCGFFVARREIPSTTKWGMRTPEISQNNHACKVNGQVILPKKDEGGENGRLTGAANVQRISKLVDEYDAAIRAGEFAPDEGWHQFKDRGGMFGAVLKAKGLI
jgi:hypothetical protein